MTSLLLIIIYLIAKYMMEAEPSFWIVETLDGKLYTTGVGVQKNNNGEDYQTGSENKAPKEADCPSDGNRITTECYCDGIICIMGRYCTDGSCSKKRQRKTSGKYTPEKVDPATLAGVWSLKAKDGWQGVFTIKKDGEISILGKKSVLQQSDNQKDFPSSEGWLKANKIHLDTTWNYYRLIEDGKMEFHHFCTDGCNRTYNNLQQYCCSGTGVKVEDKVPSKNNGVASGDDGVTSGDDGGISAEYEVASGDDEIDTQSSFQEADCPSDGKKITTNCDCDGIICIVGRYCTDSACSKKAPKEANCLLDGHKITTTCDCDGISCPVGKYCTNSECSKNQPNCKSDGSKITTKCNCDGISCPVDKYCIDGSCSRTVPDKVPSKYKGVTSKDNGVASGDDEITTQASFLARKPFNCNSDGKKLTKECLCDDLVCPMDRYCIDGICSRNAPNCTSDGKEISTECNCDGISCPVGRYCIDNLCSNNSAKPSNCNSGVKKITKECLCDDLVCPVDRYCVDGICSRNGGKKTPMEDIPGGESCKEKNIVYWGEGMGKTFRTKDGFKASSEKICSMHCGDEPNCEVWVFHKIKKTCQLKIISETNKKNSTAYISGRKHCKNG